jgi:hypothetical protein
MNLIHSTGMGSLFIQVITALIDLYVLFFCPVPASMILLHKLLWLELFVQLVEGTFYVWMITHFQSIKNITPYRYRDWFFSTPVMLFSLCVFFLYTQGTQSTTLSQIVEQYGSSFLLIFALNAAMLLAGYLGETGRIPSVWATALGFVPFFAFFALIWFQFVHSTVSAGIFAFFFFVWGLYGIASLQSYASKNVMYNVLDLFSKNVINIALAILLYFQITTI